MILAIKMYNLRQAARKIGFRYLSKASTSAHETFMVEKLENRGLIRVQGAEVIPFLQGLVTNDMNHLTRGSTSIYTMFLNKGGKVLYDSIVYRTSQDDTFLVECDKEVTQELEKHLKLFRVRRKIDIQSISQDYSVWVMFKDDIADFNQLNNENTQTNDGSVALQEESGSKPISPLKDIAEEAVVCTDPRLKELGIRLVVPSPLTMMDINKFLPERTLQATDPTNDYKYFRYKLGVAEGIEELPPSKCFPLESNCDYMHGVSFHKGCYLGQELTARTHHTGVIRKRIMPFCTDESIDESSQSIEMPNQKSVGKIRGIKGKNGIGLIRIEQALESVSLFIGTVNTKVIVPHWWPKELPSKASLKVKQS